MANICLYKIRVKGTKAACYALVNMMPLYSWEKEYMDEEGPDDGYSLLFSGACKWGVDCYTSWDKALTAPYTAEQVEVLPDNWRRRFFRKIMNQDVYRVTEELKQEVIFRKFNLMDSFPFRKKLHVVFLRNVMIYFDDKTKRELVQKIYDVMEPGGYLFIGQTESLDKSIKGFDMVKPSIYRKREG